MPEIMFRRVPPTAHACISSQQEQGRLDQYLGEREPTRTSQSRRHSGMTLETRHSFATAVVNDGPVPSGWRVSFDTFSA
jgi:hypothetical protein